ncbi:hypothetical protein ACSBR2_023114 [Camellia fascicularis]
MAGMLPGVECARRRRFHQSGGWADSPNTSTGHGWTRRPSFCLYTSKHESPLSSSSSLKRNTENQAHQDEKLGEVAREAKERLNERLRAHRKSETKRNNNPESLRCIEGRTVISRDLQIEVFRLKKNASSRMFSCAKLGWKGTDQDECAICLEQFKSGETLVNIPCSHRFHSRCLVPWLQTNAHCPCCRMEI